MKPTPPKAAVVALLVAVACGPPSPAPLSQADRDALRRAGEQLRQAVIEGDADAVAAQYAGDAYLDPPFSPAVTGRDAIRDHYAEATGGVMEFEHEARTVDGEGNLAYVRGRWSLTARPPGAEGDSTVSHEGGFVEVRRRQGDGSWLIVEHIVHARPPTVPGQAPGGG